jgi:hypothetical protein
MTDEPDNPNCYFRQQALIDPPAGGRYRQRTAQINGTEPTVTPLAVPEWCIDPVPTEPPVCVEDALSPPDVDWSHDLSLTSPVSATDGAEGVAAIALPATPEASVDMSTIPDLAASADGECTDTDGVGECTCADGIGIGECTVAGMPNDDVDASTPEPTFLGALSSIHRRRDFHLVKE